MELTDITKTPLYIRQRHHVFKKQNSKSRRLLVCGNRHSDAFIYLIEGSISYMFYDETEFSLRADAGDILYLGYDSNYTMYIHTDYVKFIYVDFDFDHEGLRKCSMFKPNNPELAKNLFEKLYQCEKKGERASFSEAMSTLYDIYGLVLAAANRPYLEKTTRHKIAEAKEFIDVHYKDADLSVAELAKQADMSEVHFRKLFRSQYDLSPMQYILSVRLQKAKELMEYPFFTLEECALQSGFSSLPYFCRVFKKNTGMTPSQHRKK